jgi:hypothetical protein
MLLARLRTRILLATALVVATFGAAASQSADPRGRMTPAELAKAIANTISATLSPVPGASIFLESVISRGNVVEMRYVMTDPAAFVRLKGNVEETRVIKASYYCNESRIAYLKQGVVIHEVVAVADGSGQLDFTFDESSCDNLPKPTQADAKTLAELALTTAKAENESPAKSSTADFRLVEATAHEGVVEERFLVAHNPMDRVRTMQILRGYFCAQHHDTVFRGLVFHLVFVLTGDVPVLDLAIDRSRC